MPDNTRYFLGYGERLTERVPPPGGGGGSDPAYTLQEAVARLSPMLSVVNEALADLPDAACPDDQAVGVVTLHPQWMAKTSHPQQLLNQYDLRQVGSRPVTVQPEATTKKSGPTPDASSELYVAGTRAAFRAWSRDLEERPATVHEQIRRLEAVRAPEPDERLRNLLPAESDSVDSEPVLLEVVLHASESRSDSYILAGFAAYAESLGARPELQRRLHAGGLCFLPVEAPVERIEELAEFAFLRVARPMPRLRSQPTFERSLPAPGLRPCPLPTEPAIDADLRIAVFDGGLSSTSPLLPWATPHEPPGIGAGTDGHLAHGHDVTSAVLFGPLAPGQEAPRPYGVVDHYRVLDKDAESDPYELYEVLRRVDEVLKTRNYELFNLSIGPYLPVEDDEVHTWTALLDAHLSNGQALAALAIGNTGDSTSPLEARIQVPADCVNALSVGAADSQRPGWSRAPYSSLGPGRSPGVVKPDVVAFGGDDREPFLVYDPDNAPALSQTRGTSFASPAALRLAAGVRAHFGGRVTALGLKALLVHAAQPEGNDRVEVGWGRIPADVADIAVCTDGMVRVIYQGELSPSQYVRAVIPLPDDPLVGLVTVASTFCYATPTEPQDPGAYTSSGLEVTFRPHSRVFASDEATVPKSASFFKKSAIATEQSLRNDAQKWETTLQADRRFQAKSLYNPVFDIHYNARTAGGSAKDADKIRYAMVLTVTAPRVVDLYDQVVRTYAGRLEALTPVVEIPIRV